MRNLLTTNNVYQQFLQLSLLPATALLLIIPQLSAAQEQPKSALTLVQRQKLEFRDSISTKINSLKQRYQQQIDSVMSSTSLDGKEKWLRINALSKERILNIQRITEQVKTRNAVWALKQEKKQ